MIGKEQKTSSGTFKVTVELPDRSKANDERNILKVTSTGVDAMKLRNISRLL